MCLVVLLLIGHNLSSGCTIFTGLCNFSTMLQNFEGVNLKNLVTLVPAGVVCHMAIRIYILKCQINTNTKKKDFCILQNFSKGY